MKTIFVLVWAGVGRSELLEGMFTTKITKGTKVGEGHAGG
jgi:hypothetical protein